ncbi:MAG: LacI family DNA-binding transcriptional regulator [Eubacteriales bacterium]|nr:LacI family DNA-binding transcriptional regulator [Eubacteriales bacterium]
MKIKMVDVARYLGVSKATVSLAVNGKPGVNEQTRQKILQCIEEMEKNDGIIQEKEVSKTVRLFRIIKVVIINHRKQVVCDPELDLWSDVLRTFDAEARKRGYLYGLTYLNETEGDLQGIIDECNIDMVAGVILFGTEMSPADYAFVGRIHKPLIIYDYEMPDGSYSSVCIDNARAVEMSLDLLKKAGASEIQYFSTGKDIYNFEKRREAFHNTLLKRGEFPQKGDIIPLGNSIAEITEQAAAYLSAHKLPDAFILENYQVSIGVLTAIRRLGITVPQSIKLVGIDEVPDYIVPDFKLTQVRIPHVERAAIAMSLLDKEITGLWNTKIRVFAVPVLINGKSV